MCVRVSSMTKSKVKNEKVISLPPRAPLFLVAIHVQPAVDSDHQIVVVVAESVQKSDIKKNGVERGRNGTCTNYNVPLSFLFDLSVLGTKLWL